jgi:hypothetical protein
LELLGARNEQEQELELGACVFLVNSKKNVE